MTRRGLAGSIARLLLEIVVIGAGGAILGVGINALSKDPANLRQAVYPASSSGTATCTASGQAAGAPKMMSVAEAVAACDGCTAGFVDARGAAAYADGHLPGAVHLPPVGHPDERASLAQLQHFTTIVVYDDGLAGNRTAACPLAEGVAARLQQSYFPDVRVLEGGWAAWYQEGGPAESGACRECTMLTGESSLSSFSSSDPAGKESGTGAVAGTPAGAR